MRARLCLAAACLTLLVGCGGSPSSVTGTGDATTTTATDAPTTTAPSANASASAGATKAPTATAKGSATSNPTSADGAGGQGGAAGTGGAATTYTDARFGFSVAVPAGFTKAGAVDDRGTKFSGPSNVTLQAYGSANLLQSSAEQVCREQAEAYTGDGGSATSQFTGDRCTVTGTLQGTTHQIETWVGSATLNHVEVTYPASSAALGQQTFTAAVASFRPGDLATAH